MTAEYVIVVYQDSADPPEWRWRTREEHNKKTVADSAEGYTEKSSAIVAAKRESGGEIRVIVENEGKPDTVYYGPLAGAETDG